jgi:hypothetical protein
MTRLRTDGGWSDAPGRRDPEGGNPVARGLTERLLKRRALLLLNLVRQELDQLVKLRKLHRDDLQQLLKLLLLHVVQLV